MTTGRWPFTTDRSLATTDHWPLTTDYWPLATGHGPSNPSIDHGEYRITKSTNTYSLKECTPCTIWMYGVHCTLYGVHRILYDVHRTLYGVHCTLYIVRRTIYTLCSYAVHVMTCSFTYHDVRRTLYQVRLYDLL